MNVSHLPGHGFIRLSQIIGNRNAKPPVAPLIPISASSWWSWVKDGRAPAPVKIGPATTAWRTAEIFALIERLSVANDCGTDAAFAKNRGTKLAEIRKQRRTVNDDSGKRTA